MPVTHFYPSSPPKQTYIPLDLHSAPWNDIFLRSRCKEINTTVGSRTQEYGRLLEKIKEAESSPRLRENFKCIMHHIPNELLVRQEIIEIVKELMTRFYLDEVKEIEKKTSASSGNRS